MTTGHYNLNFICKYHNHDNRTLKFKALNLKTRHLVKEPYNSLFTNVCGGYKCLVTPMEYGFMWIVQDMYD